MYQAGPQVFVPQKVYKIAVTGTLDTDREQGHPK